jgi:hypothetical protein
VIAMTIKDLAKLLLFTSSFTIVSNNAFAQQAEPKKSLSAQQFKQRQAELLQSKNVQKWPVKAGIAGNFTIDLTVSECTFLGGKVEFWADCGTTLMKCTAPNGHAMCIDEIK